MRLTSDQKGEEFILLRGLLLSCCDESEGTGEETKQSEANHRKTRNLFSLWIAPLASKLDFFTFCTPAVNQTHLFHESQILSSEGSSGFCFVGCCFK